MAGVESRKYRILGVLGQGGFGKVYRARLESGEGFVKDVAVKLMKDDDVPESVLMRFRDEARILGLIRDRAIVSVDPPTRIAGKWAVVMEYVDGASCTRLGKKHGPFPPGVGVEVVAEVARALDKVFNQKGPEGNPLRLLHRDIKPANIQLTPSGEVKVLDFGIARAEFENREAQTTTHIGGTPGYIAPERLYGEEGPAGDVFSLGIVLCVLLTGKKPPRGWVSGGVGDDAITRAKSDSMRLALLLAREMVNPDPNARPSARDVERRCHSIRAQCHDDPTLRDWSEEAIPALSEMSPDDLVGSVITETIRAVPHGPDELPSEGTSESQMIRIMGRGAMLAAGGTSLVIGGAVVGVVAVAALLLALVGLPTSEPDAVDPPATAQLVVPEPEPEPEPDAEPAPEEDSDAAVVDAEVEPEPEPEPAPVVVKPAPVAKKAAKPPPKAQPVGPTRDITFTSIPMGAQVWVDGKKVSSTPIFGHGLPDGTHAVKMVSGDQVIEKSIRVGRRSPTRHVWKIGEDAWESGF